METDHAPAVIPSSERVLSLIGRLLPVESSLLGSLTDAESSIPRGEGQCLRKKDVQFKLLECGIVRVRVWWRERSSN